MPKRMMLAATGAIAAAGVAIAVVSTTQDPVASNASSAKQDSTTTKQEEKLASSEKSATPSPKKEVKKALYKGKTTASYFWDDGSGVNGDTGAPASGKPMQKGMFASPSWPMGTKVKVTYKDRSITGFVGDRGPGAPSHNGIMLDLDTYTFRKLYDGEKPESKYDAGVGAGHIKIKYEVLKWGKGPGKKGAPQPF